jgi:hypothetical protein
MLIVSGLDDSANAKRINVRARTRSEGSSNLFAHELRKAVAVRRVGVIVLVDGKLV